MMTWGHLYFYIVMSEIWEEVNREFDLSNISGLLIVCKELSYKQ